MFLFYLPVSLIQNQIKTEIKAKLWTHNGNEKTIYIYMYVFYIIFLTFIKSVIYFNILILKCMN